MLFAAPSFLFLFLPLTLAIYALVPPKFRRYALLAFNLIFYIFVCRNAPISILLAFLTAAFTYSAGFAVAVTHQRKTVLLSALVLGVAFLIYRLFHHTSLLAGSPYYPLGASFYLLSALSYLVDIYRNDAPHAKNFADLLLYMFFFPTIIVGPIIKYKDFGVLLEGEMLSLERFSVGVKCYISGFLKRLSVSAVLGYALEQLLAAAGDRFGIWIALLAFALMCGYLLFAIGGYYDMACGLMLMFGIGPPRYPSAEKIRIVCIWTSFRAWMTDYLVHPILRKRQIPRVLRYALAGLVVCCFPLLWLKTRWYLLPIGAIIIIGGGLYLLMLRQNLRHNPRLNRVVRILGRVVLCLFMILFIALLPFERAGDIAEFWQMLLQEGWTLPTQTVLLGLSVLKYLPIGLIGLGCLFFLREGCTEKEKRIPIALGGLLRGCAFLLVMCSFAFSILHLMPQFPECAVNALPYLVF